MNLDDRILITGHQGFVGSNLLEYMQGLGYKNIITHTFDECDLRDQDDVDYIFKKNEYDYAFLCAAKASGIKANMEDPYHFLLDNLEIQNNTIKACIKYNVKKVLFLGSCCTYPAHYTEKIKEEWLLQGEPEKTNQGYAIGKLAGLKLCEYANKQFGERFIVLNPANLFGPLDNFKDDNSHVLSALIRKIYDAKINNKPLIEIWGTGTAEREFLYVFDLCECMVWLMDNFNVKDLPYPYLNVGFGKSMKIIDLANKIKQIIGWDGEFTLNPSYSDGMKFKCLNVDKINSMGWKAKTGLEEGLKKTIEWYIKNET